MRQTYDPQTQYEVAFGALKVPAPEGKAKRYSKAEFVRQGEEIPEGTFTDEDMERFLKGGRIRAVRGSQSARRSAPRKQQRGKWSVNPESLRNKSLTELRQMVVAIDPKFKVKSLRNKQEAIEQLTQDFDKVFEEPVAPHATDKTMPGVSLVSDETEGRRSGLGARGQDRGLSPRAAANLERAKEQAQSDADVEEPEENDTEDDDEDNE